MYHAGRDQFFFFDETGLIQKRIFAAVVGLGKYIIIIKLPIPKGFIFYLFILHITW